MAHGLQVESFKQPKGLAEIGALGPRAALAYGVSLVVDRDGLFDRGDVGGKIGFAQEAALLDVICFQIVRYVVAILVPPVEPVACVLEFFFTASRRILFFLDHFSQCDREFWMPGFGSVASCDSGARPCPLSAFTC